MHTEETNPSGIALSIVLPCLNEAASLGGCIRDARAGLAALGITGEIVVADNGSTDNSIAIARDCGARVVQVRQRGYGAALNAGIAAASGKYIIIADSDRSYDLSALLPFWTRLLEGDHMVIGNRFIGGIRPGAMPVLNRFIGNPLLTTVGRRLFRADIGDFQCGIRAAQTDALRALNLRATGMEHASEMIARAAQAGLRITEVPTVLSIATPPTNPPPPPPPPRPPNPPLFGRRARHTPPEPAAAAGSGFFPPCCGFFPPRRAGGGGRAV